MKTQLTDFETNTNHTKTEQIGKYRFLYLLVGMLFGIVLVKSEMVSWFRMQEMFRFQSFHMYGVMATAVAVAAISILLIKKLNIKTIQGETIHITPRKFNKGQIYGGLLFGLGWGLTGACPGPILAQIGMGAGAVIIIFLSALAGTWLFGKFRDRLLG